MRPHRLLAISIFAALAAAGGTYPVQAQQTPAPIDASAPPAPAESPPPIPSPKPTADDPKIHKLAVQQFLAWQSGTINRDLYSDTVNGELTDDVLDRGTKTLARLGGLQEADFQGISQANKTSLYVYTMKCQNGSVNMDFSVDPQGKIGLIFFV